MILWRYYETHFIYISDRFRTYYADISCIFWRKVEIFQKYYRTFYKKLLNVIKSLWERMQTDYKEVSNIFWNILWIYFNRQKIHFGIHYFEIYYRFIMNNESRVFKISQKWIWKDILWIWAIICLHKKFRGRYYDNKIFLGNNEFHNK